MKSEVILTMCRGAVKYNIQVVFIYKVCSLDSSHFINPIPTCRVVSYTDKLIGLILWLSRDVFHFSFSFHLLQNVNPPEQLICLFRSPLGGPLAELGVHKGEQQFGSLLVKCDMLSISLSQGPIELRLEEASGPCMQMQSIHIPRKLIFAKTAEGNSFLTELAQRVEKIILLFERFSCRTNKHL